jgi:anti-sigma factor RsiW
MTCREAADFLADYLSGSLASDVRSRFDHHLSRCPNCRAYLATYEATVALEKRALASDDAGGQPAVPDEVVSAILKAVRE